MMARIRTFGLEVGADSRVRGRDLPLEGTKAFAAPALSAEQNGPSSILVTWSDVSGDSYSLEVSTNGGSTWDELVSQSGTSYTHSGVSFPGTYLYRVRATKDAVVSDYSNTETVSMVDVPAAPGGLTVTGATTSSISLSWNDTVGEESFTVEASVDGLGSWTSAGSTSQNVVTFTHSGLAESVQRYYRVIANNKAGGSIPSSTANSWTVPAAPTGLTATAISTTQIDLSWTDVSTGNQSYRVERSTDNVNWTEIATGLSATATTYSATGLSGATQYWFRVRAANAARNSDYSSTATATTTLAAPSGLTATATSSTQINLSWTDNSANEDGFKVERSTDNSTWTEIAGNVAANSTTYSATGLTASTLYYFRVRAYRGAVNSSYTSSASATTNAAAGSTLEYLVVAGGGGGCRGGGGAGGYRTATGFSLTVGTSYTITVGAGGAGGAASSGTVRGATGSNSVFSTITSDGGGGGGGADSSTRNGANGGSGGGGGHDAAIAGTGGTATSGQGNSGGSVNASFLGSPYSMAGGGGAGAAGGANTSNSQAGNGGNGSASSITGSSVTRAGGGGGGVFSTGGTAGTGGTGGGGAGGVHTTNGTSGSVNTGSGGGGSGNGGTGGSGGSGVVILRMATANYSGTTTGSPTVTTSGSDTILTYNASGTYTA